MATKVDHVAIYGSVAIKRSYCEECEGWAFVINRVLQCCGKQYTAEPAGFRNMIHLLERKSVPERIKRKILNAQDYRCFYCNRRFGSKVTMRDGLRKTIRCTFDHVIPFAYSRNDSEENLVAACHFCNGWKSDLLFSSLEEVQVYVHQKWDKQESTTGEVVPVVRYGVQSG